MTAGAGAVGAVGAGIAEAGAGAGLGGGAAGPGVGAAPAGRAERAGPPERADWPAAPRGGVLRRNGALRLGGRLCGRAGGDRADRHRPLRCRRIGRTAGRRAAALAHGPDRDRPVGGRAPRVALAGIRTSARAALTADPDRDGVLRRGRAGGSRRRRGGGLSRVRRRGAVGRGADRREAIVRHPVGRGAVRGRTRIALPAGVPALLAGVPALPAGVPALLAGVPGAAPGDPPVAFPAEAGLPGGVGLPGGGRFGAVARVRLVVQEDRAGLFHRRGGRRLRGRRPGLRLWLWLGSRGGGLCSGGGRRRRLTLLRGGAARAWHP